MVTVDAAGSKRRSLLHSTLFLRKSTQKQRPKGEIRVVDTLDNVMDVTTDDLNRIFGKNVDSEDDFEVDPPQMAPHRRPDVELRPSTDTAARVYRHVSIVYVLHHF